LGMMPPRKSNRISKLRAARGQIISRVTYE
jgi:hypothetical protein